MTRARDLSHEPYGLASSLLVFRMKSLINAARLMIIIAASAGSPLLVARAQVTQSFAGISDLKTGRAVCMTDSGQQTGSSSAHCATPTTGGDAFSRGSANQASRLLQTSVSLKQSGATGSFSSLAAAESYAQNTMYILGAPASGDQVVFRFLTTRVMSFLGTVGQTPYGYTELFVSSGLDPNAIGLVFIESGRGGNTSTTLDHAVLTSLGVDVSFGMNAFAPVTIFNFEGVLVISLDPDQLPGATLDAQYDVRLAGIDAIDARNNVLARAIFDSVGNATLDFGPTAVPEPPTLGLVALGLMSIGACARRRSPRASRTRIQ